MISPLMYLRIGALIALLAIFLWGAATVRHWRNDSLRVDAAEAKTAEIARQASDALVALSKAHRAALSASQTYQKELHEISNRPAITGPVRLCVPARVSSRPAQGAAPSGPSPAVPAAGVGDPGDAADHREGPDIAADLDAFARKCEAVAAQGRALQALY